MGIALAANQQRRHRESLLDSLSADVSDVLRQVPCVYTPELEELIRVVLPADRDEQVEFDVSALARTLSDAFSAVGESILWLGTGPAFRVDAQWARERLAQWLEVADDLVLATPDGARGVYASGYPATPFDDHPDGSDSPMWDYATW